MLAQHPQHVTMAEAPYASTEVLLEKGADISTKGNDRKAVLQPLQLG